MQTCKCWKECYNIEELDDVLNVAVNRIHTFLTKNGDLLEPIAVQCREEAWEAISKWKERRRAGKDTWTM